MVQELHVLRCFSCKTFQSHIVKKTSKWECKVCGVKQSIKKVYGRGSGKDCRIHTQKLNTLKGQKEEIESYSEQAKESNVPESSVRQLMINEPSSFASLKLDSKRTKSKWVEFIDENETAVFKNDFTKQENISSTPTVSLKYSVQKRKIKNTLDNEEFGGYSDDCDSVDMNYYSSFNNKCSSAYTKKTKFNNCHISISNSLNKIDSNNYYNSQGISETSINTRYSHFKTQSDSKSTAKSGGCVESENNQNTTVVPSISNKNNHHRDNKVSLKWGKYLDQVDYKITTSSVTTESECDLKWTKYLKNITKKEKGVSCFQVDKKIGEVLYNDCDIMSSNEFRRMSTDCFVRESSDEFEGVFSGHIVPSNETIENIVPNCNITKESINHCDYISNNSGNNYQSNFFFDPKNHKTINTSSNESLKYKFSKECDSEVELSLRQKEQFKCKTVHSFPVFEQNRELNDRDFQLDF